ncbi:ferritin-like domain-containing protein [Thioalkalivibrio thiocyanodenitrificans]|uniref:ferritin-like domain-containing protein n=1 Tax=Thioalkalivibrio thiocyanodenitrificans TaxID=243063 RepID=UPI000362D3E6|nr:ferritin-like domain-containing protein [Thioalkalivibrio thiocyanodenitrificans]
MTDAAEPVTCVHAEAFEALMQADPSAKCRMTAALRARWRAGRVNTRHEAEAPRAVPVPGRPGRPRLVDPMRVPRRKLTTPRGQAALVHAIAHIEFNAINLALDAVYRFRGLPGDFCGDWLQVAAEEAQHFLMLRRRLSELGHAYGDFEAHDGLWDMAVKTAHDPLLRMALVPRVLEARGLDVTPGMMERLRAAGDTRTLEILGVILREEIGHVAIGTRWFRYLCDQRGLDPDATFGELVAEYMPGRIRPPFHEAARKAAGFTEAEMAILKSEV